MPISSGFSQELNPNYYIRKPTNRELLDEAIFFKRNEPVAVPRPVEVVHRPVIKETIFLPERQSPPTVPIREYYTMAPEPAPIPTAIYTTPMRTVPKASFSLIPALGLNADCPCWSWILIILGLLILLALIALALYYILVREGKI